jgi:hypothetical protein
MFSFTHSKNSHAHSQAEAHVQKATVDLVWVHGNWTGTGRHYRHGGPQRRFSTQAAHSVLSRSVQATTL